MDLTTCAANSADDTTYQMTEPVFDGSDIIEYGVDSGTYNIPFVDWLVDSNVHTSCLIDL